MTRPESRHLKDRKRLNTSLRSWDSLAQCGRHNKNTSMLRKACAQQQTPATPCSKHLDDTKALLQSLKCCERHVLNATLFEKHILSLLTTLTPCCKLQNCGTSWPEADTSYIQCFLSAETLSHEHDNGPETLMTSKIFNESESQTAMTYSFHW